ncbi:hypothetical protein P0C28_11190 [Aeromonas hydrophila]|uniref:hypothetical protein n=1 Tax=Aeromonas hydrophila TaxID=644 RepID=UPI0023AEDFBA|nr:hypothetical protein [Aeromonas hydrophila]MDE8809818.1 hypothetical protein [Aeromonas hydrophila]
MDYRQTEYAVYPTLGGELILRIKNIVYVLEGKKFGLEDGWIDDGDKRTDGYLLHDDDSKVQVLVKVNSPDHHKEPLKITVTEIRHHKLGPLEPKDATIENELIVEKLY